VSARRTGARHSAGILLYRFVGALPRVLLVHPGGPFWRNKDVNAWSIPKGEIDGAETPEAAALREFAEETGHRPRGPLVRLGETTQAGGKRVTAFALEGDFDPARLQSTPFELEWPPRSGRLQRFPELDRADWVTLDAAREKMIPRQVVFLDRLRDILAISRSS
jgi:predicted NUDIX family NTP pyrophosphohydrolase